MGRRISEKVVESYWQDGIVFPLPVLNSAEVASFLAAIEQTEQSLGGRPTGQQVGQTQLHFAWARRLVTHPAVLEIVEDVIGPDILVHSATIFKKHPGEGAYVSWHQDGYYMKLDPPDFVSVWIALTDSDRENGCLRVVPGSHRNGVVPHNNHSAGERNLLTSGLEIEVEVDETLVTDVILRAGEASLHHVNIVHGSNPNYSTRARAGFAIRFVAPHVRQASRHHPVVLARGVDRYGYFDLYPNPAEEDFDLAAEAHIRFSEQLLAQRQAAGRRA